MFPQWLDPRDMGSVAGLQLLLRTSLKPWVQKSLSLAVKSVWSPELRIATRGFCTRSTRSTPRWCWLKVSAVDRGPLRGTLKKWPVILTSRGVLQVRCFGTEGRLSDRPSPPKDDVYDYITFRGSDIKDITLYEVPGPHLQHGLPPDPAIVQVRLQFCKRSKLRV